MGIHWEIPADKSEEKREREKGREAGTQGGGRDGRTDGGREKKNTITPSQKKKTGETPSEKKSEEHKIIHKWVQHVKPPGNERVGEGTPRQGN